MLIELQPNNIVPCYAHVFAKTMNEHLYLVQGSGATKMSILVEKERIIYLHPSLHYDSSLVRDYYWYRGRDIVRVVPPEDIQNEMFAFHLLDKEL